MGTTYSTQYYLTISELSTDDNPEPMILYSNLTDNLDNIQDFILGNYDSKISKNIKKEIDNWFETNKKALNELQEDNLEYEKRRKEPVRLYHIHSAAGMYRLPPDDDYEDRLGMRAETERDEQMARDWKIIVNYKHNSNPYNHYIKSGFLECNTISDFFDKSKYEERYSKIDYTHPEEATGLEYFFLFFESYMNKKFSWKGNNYKQIPFKLTLQVRYNSPEFKSRKGFNKMLGLSPKDWRSSKDVFEEAPPDNNTSNKKGNFLHSLIFGGIEKDNEKANELIHQMEQLAQPDQ